MSERLSSCWRHFAVMEGRQASLHDLNLCRDFDLHGFVVVVGQQMDCRLEGMDCGGGAGMNVAGPGVLVVNTDDITKAEAAWERGEHYVRTGTLP